MSAGARLNRGNEKYCCDMDNLACGLTSRAIANFSSIYVISALTSSQLCSNFELKIKGKAMASAIFSMSNIITC